MSAKVFTNGFSAAALRWPKALNLPHLDAGENAFFLRELEFLSKKVLHTKYANLMARKLVPVENEMGAAMQSYTYQVWDSKGSAKAIADMSDDLPSVNVHGSENTQRLQPYGVSFQYSLDEILAASAVGRPLEADRAAVARQVLEQKIDELTAIGDSARALKGFTNLSSTDSYTAGTKGAGGLTWAVATSDEILADMNGMKRQMRVNTKEIENPTRLVLDTGNFELISSKPRTALSDTTILQFFRANNPGIEVLSWERLSAGTGQGDPTGLLNRAIMYNPTPENLKLLMPLEFTMQPPQPRNMAFVVNCWVKCGGVINPFPKSISYMDGI